MGIEYLKCDLNVADAFYTGSDLHTVKYFVFGDGDTVLGVAKRNNVTGEDSNIFGDEICCLTDGTIVFIGIGRGIADALNRKDTFRDFQA